MIPRSPHPDAAADGLLVAQLTLFSTVGLAAAATVAQWHDLGGKVLTTTAAIVAVAAAFIALPVASKA